MLTGTLTFHSPNNNGSFLQAYALQKVLLDSGVENEIIHFYSKQQESQYGLFRKTDSFSNIVRNALSLFHFSRLKKRLDKFEYMRNKYLILTKRLYNKSEVLDEIKKYDFVICGSDQIWNTSARDFTDIYFLPNVENKKITYAISSGSMLENEKMLPYILDFNCISVRDNYLKDKLSEFDVQSSLVLDPTFLLQKIDYEKICSPDRRIKKKYVFLYIIDYSKSALNNAKKIANKMGVKLVTCFTGYSYYRCRKYGIKVLFDVGPDDFLNLIKNAEAVCTNSFHGLALSINYGKKIFRLQSLDSNGNCVIDNRLDSFINYK